MKIDILNTWVLESIKIGIHLYNQQSLEYFRYILSNIKKLNKPTKFFRGPNITLTRENFGASKKEISLSYKKIKKECDKWNLCIKNNQLSSISSKFPISFSFYSSSSSSYINIIYNVYDI